MNGRIKGEATPAGRLAAVVQSVVIELRGKGREADYADFRVALEPYLHVELLMARIEEARTLSGRVLTARIKELAVELQVVDTFIHDREEGNIT